MLLREKRRQLRWHMLVRFVNSASYAGFTLEWDLPAFNSENIKSENDYNKLIGEQLSGNVFDRNCWCMLVNNDEYNGIRGRVEPCDVLFRHNDEFLFFHVKRYRSSFDLSHLFTQGNVSTELLLNEEEFRQFIHDRLNEEDQGPFIEAIKKRTFQIVFVIIFDRAPPQNGNIIKSIPILSAVNLYKTIKDFQTLGVNVSYCLKFNEANRNVEEI